LHSHCAQRDDAEFLAGLGIRPAAERVREPPNDAEFHQRHEREPGEDEPEPEAREEKARRKPVPPMDWARLAPLPVPRRVWFHDHWIAPVPTALFGAPGTGKTLLCQQWGTCLSMARDFVAPFVFERPLIVLMWACEDAEDELWRRQIDVCEWLGIGLADLAGKFHLVPRQGEENTLLEMVHGQLVTTSVYKELREQVNDLKADVFFLDNVGQAHGGSENDKHQVTVFTNMQAGLVRGRPFCPFMLGHPSRMAGSEFAGNIAWEGSVRMRQ
jgi:hypothetical protein